MNLSDGKKLEFHRQLNDQAAELHCPFSRQPRQGFVELQGSERLDLKRFPRWKAIHETSRSGDCLATAVLSRPSFAEANQKPNSTHFLQLLKKKAAGARTRQLLVSHAP